jgi:DNA-binding NarL/FixJ family response regulator
VAVRFALQGNIVRPEVQEGGPEARARLVIADDHEGTRVLLRTLLSLHPEIEVVGEAENGEEAARLAVSGEADIALLDTEMPRMDGLTAAELIRSVRPQARVILHTASADETKRARARELGLTLLVKGDFDATIAAVTERLQEAKQGSPLRAGLEALVLSALAARSAEAVVVINAEQSISFYSAAAAKLLRLPFPAEPMTLAEMRLRHPLFDTESLTSPLAAAISEHRAAEGELSEVLPDGALRTYWVKAVPFFDAGRYLGAATYMTVLPERPSV